MISPDAHQKSSFLAARSMLGLAAATLLMLAAMAQWVRVPACHAGPPPIRLTDAAGLTLEMAAPPRRIVVVGPAPFILLNMLYMFPEASQRLVGYEQKVKGDDRFLSLVDPGFGDKTALNANPGPEHIAALRPDVVLIKSNSVGALEKALGVIGIPVLHLHPETPPDFLKSVDLLGMLLNNPGRADQIRNFYQDRLDRINTPLKTVGPGEKPEVLLVKYGDRTGGAAVQVPGSTWIQTRQVQMTGGRPVWLDQFPRGQGWQVVGFEQIAQWNPEIIFMVVWYRMEGCRIIGNLMADPKWGHLKAVAGDRFFLVPEDIYGWDTSDPRWILGALWMVSHTHPQLFPEMNMEKEVLVFFRTLYNLNPAMVDAHILSRVKNYACR
jgi:iron complex transport system substrate-binding protein